MAHSKETSAIASHLWNYHERTKSSGTLTERTLLHEEIHALGDASGDIGHEHGPDGEFIVKCPCGHSHECTVLAPEGE